MITFNKVYIGLTRLVAAFSLLYAIAYMRSAPLHEFLIYIIAGECFLISARIDEYIFKQEERE